MSFRVGFFGTPEFGAVHLERLIREGEEVAFVVTQPDRARGRGRLLRPPPVKETALKYGLQVLQPRSLKHPETVEAIARYGCDVYVVVAYGLLLPTELLKAPERGAVNVHASLLPRLRGPAPIQWAIILGYPVTGVTTMLMNQGMDTGDILLQSSVPIRPQDTAGTLHDRLAEAGCELLTKTLKGLKRRILIPSPQDSLKATYAPLLEKADGLIQWDESANRIAHRIRGLDPWPGAFSFLQGRRVLMYGGSHEAVCGHERPGTVVGLLEGGLRIAAGEGCVLVHELQLEGRKRLPVNEFLRGFPLAPGTVFGAP